MISKKILLLCIMTLLCTPCFAIDDEISAKPSWAEFCPKQYLDIKLLNAEEYSNKFFHGVFKPTKKKLEEYNKTAAYWVNRKQHFDDYVNTCLSLPINSQSVCFMKVRESEFEENRKMHFTVQDEIDKNGAMSERMRNNQMMMINNQLRQFNPMY